MARARLKKYIQRVREEVISSFATEHTSHQIAASFALGTFITMLPTLGVGLLVFVVLVSLFEWINKIALFASVLVFNPVVKWGVYLSSFSLGILLLGPVEGVGMGEVPSLDEGNDILVRLLVGNLILAVIATVAAYFAVYRLVEAYDRHELPVVEETVEEFVQAIEQEHDVDADVAARNGHEDRSG